MIGVIAFLISSESAIEVNMTAGELDAARAEYVAQAGMQHALRHHAQQGCGPYTDLTTVAFGVDEYDTKLTHDLGSTTPYTIPVDQDAWIRNDQPTVNKGADQKLHTRFEGGNIEYPLLRYDLSSIPAKSAILSATAWFYLTNIHPEGPVDLHPVTADWAEADATWDSMNASIGANVIASIPAQATAGTWVPVNLTSQVQAWINGEVNHGIALGSTSEGSHGQYNSRESGNAPYLEVTVGTPPTSPAKLKSTSKLDGGGAATMVRKDVYLRQSPASHTQLVLSDGAGQDAMLDSFYSSRNYGNHEIEVETIGSDENSLIRFDRLAIPPGARVISAQLELYHYMTESTQVNPGVEVYRVTRDWVEGTKDGSGTADGATWQTSDGSSNWTQNGGDHDVSPVASSDISAAVNDWETWEIGELVQGWIDGTYPNYGLLLKGTGSIEVRFASKEDADPALRPRLTISYSCTCGEVCMTPQGSGKIALIGDDNTPDPDDQMKIAIIESWGYDVDFYEDQDADTINWSNYDLAYVSETTITSGFSGDPANIPIGVVNEEPKLYDEFLLASSESEHVGDTIDIVDNSHYITMVFPQGPLPIYSGAMEILSADTPLAADLQVLGEFSSAASLTALDKGAMTTSGTGAAARRVTLPLGQHSAAGFDWSKLNNNGYLLVQRAIEWGMNKGKGAAGNLLMVVPDPSSLNSRDSSKKDLIESWNYAVTLFNDGESQANFDAAAAANDVIYVSGSISGGALADKLTGSPTPIVNEFNGKLDNFGFSSSTGTTVATDTFTSTNAAHYISQPFVGGAVTHFTTSLTMPVPSGTLAPDLVSVASASGAPRVILALDTGAERWDGNPAPARRVHLPFGAATASQMTDDGQTLMRRALEWGAGAENPDFSTELLFVVADPSSLTGAESAKKSLIESWGYTVNLIDDADSAANFFNAYAVNNVVYVSGEVSDSAIGTKLIKVPIGIVNEQIALHDEMLLSTSAGTNDFNRVLVIDNTHYITEGINTGWHFITTTDQPLNALEGTLAAGLTNLAEVWISGTNYEFGLAVVDVGGLLTGGEPSPGRRVQLPWGTAGFDFSALNANGQNLMRRAIEWAGGAEIDLSPIAHWKLDETVGNTAVDSEGGHDGTLVGTPDWVTGLVDGALDLDGASDGVQVPHSDELSITEALTLMAWVKSDGFGGYDMVLTKGNTGPGWNYYFGALDDEILFGLHDGSYHDFTTSGLALAPDTWHHITATFDNGADTIKLYHNGIEVHSVNTTLNLVANGNDIYLGQSENGAYWAGLLDDVRIYNRVLSASEIQDIHDVSAPVAVAYTEAFEPWNATASDTWQTVGLGTYGVPAGAVVEVAVINDSGSRQRWGGVRAVGSTLDRRLQLQEAEAGGTDVVTMHVQADASSQIQHYSDATGDVRFILLGYWSGASYVELFETFSAGSSNSWVTEEVADEGLGANQVAEVVIVNTSTGNERLAGVRPVGSTFQRRFMLHDAQGDGVDALTMMVTTNDDEEVEVYASNAGDVDFYVIGYWDTPPGTYTATGGSHGSVSAPNNWETIDLSAYGVPADSIAQFVLANENTGTENSMRVREVGSTINNRALLLHEAEGGGSDLGSLHANVDASSQLQWSAGQGATGGLFYPVGWWVLSP